MKKYLIGLLSVLFVADADAIGVVLSDTALPEEEVTVVSDFNSGEKSKPEEKYVLHQTFVAPNSFFANDTSDPLFFIGDNQFLSDTYITFPHERMHIGQYLGYGINNNFVIHAKMHYQIDFSGNDENGFSSTEIGGTYRMNDGLGQSHIVSDALFGLKLWGASHVRTPEYADSSYYAGMRFGRQYSGVTLSGTVKSTWVFSRNRGLSYLNFIPEAYFRLQDDWRAGIGLDLLKSTNTRLLDNQQWLNFKLVRQYGNTQYVGNVGYEFDNASFQLGANVKILF